MIVSGIVLISLVVGLFYFEPSIDDTERSILLWYNKIGDREKREFLTLFNK